MLLYIALLQLWALAQTQAAPWVEIQVQLWFAWMYIKHRLRMWPRTCCPFLTAAQILHKLQTLGSTSPEDKGEDAYIEVQCVSVGLVSSQTVRSPA